MASKHSNSQNQQNSTPASRSEEIDKTQPTEASPGYDLPPGQSAIEAARVGQEDQSQDVGTRVPAHHDRMASGAPTTAGDPDALQEQAKVVGEEAIGGTTPTPDQSNVDDIAAAVGINTKAEHPVKVKHEMDRRDEQRYELDPESKGPGDV